MYKNVEERISILKAQLVADHVFFGIFLSNTEIVKVNHYRTAATDGLRIFYNENFFNQLTDAELKSILIHEVFHMMYSHCDKLRRGVRHPKKWNHAVDYAINWEIMEMDRDKIKLPHNVIIDNKEFKVFYDPQYRNMYAEDIYDQLDDALCNEESIDIHLDKELDEDTLKELEDRILSSYEIIHRENGKLSPGIMRVVSEIRKSRIPWTRILQRYIGNILGKDNYSYESFNRRFLSQDLYLPGLRSNKLDTIAIAIDTSASINKIHLGMMKHELRKLSGIASNVIVMSCDNEIHSFDIINDISNFEQAIKNIRGEGSTDFRPPFDELRKRKIKPQFLIYMTDGMGTYPARKDVSYPVIWTMTSNKIAPFGMTIQMI